MQALGKLEVYPHSQVPNRAGLAIMFLGGRSLDHARSMRMAIERSSLTRGDRVFANERPRRQLIDSGLLMGLKLLSVEPYG